MCSTQHRSVNGVGIPIVSEVTGGNLISAFDCFG